MKRFLKWLMVVTLIIIGAWGISTLLQVVSISQESKRDRAHLNQEVANLKADNAQLKKGLDEANRRCNRAKNCTPVEPPEIITLRDDPEIDQPEIDQPEPDDPEPDDSDPDDPETQDAEIQDPEVDDAPVPGPSGSPGAEGSQGPAGPQGEKGDPGRGVESFQCDPSTGRWVVTYTDGDVEDGGTCLMIPGNSGGGDVEQ